MTRSGEVRSTYNRWLGAQTLPFSSIDASSVLRALTRVAERDDDFADVFFERLEEIELPPHDDPGPGLRVRREQGLAVRLLRDGRTWLASRDGIGPDELTSALRQVARAVPRAGRARPTVEVERWREAPDAPELIEASSALAKTLRTLDLPADARWTLRRHRRWVKVLGTVLTSATERESFYSLDAEVPRAGVRVGALTPRLDPAWIEGVAGTLADRWRARGAEAPAPGPTACVLGPDAAAVLLHEAVAHALEVDHLARGGSPTAALGVAFGNELLDVFDDPSSAPDPVRRRADDEGFPVQRRCLLRAGAVQQPLADATWARRLDELSAGAGRRASRHQPPGPRCHHLILAPRDASLDDLLAGADGGLWLPHVARGGLDPLSGRLTLRFDHGRRIVDGRLGDAVGPCGVRGRVGEVLDAVRGVGAESVAAGAGWCAKDGAKLPVWATAPPIRLDALEVVP